MAEHIDSKGQKDISFFVSNGISSFRCQWIRPKVVVGRLGAWIGSPSTQVALP
jgi:hypothetical protein